MPRDLTTWISKEAILTFLQENGFPTITDYRVTNALLVLRLQRFRNPLNYRELIYPPQAGDWIKEYLQSGQIPTIPSEFVAN